MLTAVGAISHSPSVESLRLQHCTALVTFAPPQFLGRELPEQPASAVTLIGHAERERGRGREREREQL